MVGVPGSSDPCTAGDYPHLHGPANHSRHRQQERAQAQGGCASCLAHGQRAARCFSVLEMEEGPWQC